MLEIFPDSTYNLQILSRNFFVPSIPVMSQGLAASIGPINISYNLKASAPYSFTMSCGAIPFPKDLDIFLPWSSTINPCVKTCLYGATPLTATDVSIEDWNHPLYWS